MTQRRNGSVMVEALSTIGALPGRIAAGIIQRSPLRGPRHDPRTGVALRGLNWLRRREDRALGTVSRFSNPVLATSCALLVIVTGALFVALQQINGALSQMRLPGMAGGGALQFPLYWDVRRASDAVAELRRSWSAYVDQIHATRVVAEPTVLANRLFWLDLVFIVSYTALLVVVLVMVRRFVGRRAALSRAHQRLLRIALRATPLLVLVDVLEDLALRAVYVTDSPSAFTIGVVPVIGSVVSALKLVLTALVVAPLLIVAVAVVKESAPVWRAVVASRAVLIVVAIAVFLLATGIGADQVDDVIRAWGARQAGFAMAASILAALVVVGTISELTGASADHPDPDHGGDPVPLTIGVALGLAALGAVFWTIGLGWGLLVPAGMALLGVLLSVPIKRFMPGGNGADSRQPDADSEPDLAPERVGTSGLRLARIAGVGLLIVLIWVMVRAAVFDLAVRVAPTRWAWLSALACAALLFTLVGAAVMVRSAALGRICAGWRWLAGIAVLASVATLLPGTAVFLGTVAVLMLGVAGGVGVLAAAVAAVRRAPKLQLRLLPAVRVLGFRRLPVATLILVWMVLVAVIDRGGFHDIRTLPAPQPGPPPTLEQAYRAWLAAGSAPGPDSARPLVLVAAQGGGIRAAVWTALVMECVFGPGPVTGSEGCASGAGELNRAAAGQAARATPLPVLLASGASGGSVGLAVWSARRVDLASSGTVADRTPRRVEDALNDDFVAADLARMLIGDLSHLLLAHDFPDRAAALEQAWEKPWPDRHTGLSRGLRETYQQANGAPGQWRIPILALNGAQVQDGCRLLASPVNFHISVPGRLPGSTPEGDLDTPSHAACGSATSGGPLRGALPRTTELVDYLCPDTDVPLSTAAHLSARFPFVSPTGRVTRGECATASGLLPPGSTSYDIDGGLFDNSGADTALDAWRALAPLAVAEETAQQRCVVPLFLQIDNSAPRNPELGQDSRPLELLAPVQALLGEISSRETVARVSAATEFASPRSPAGSPVRVEGRDVESRYFRIALTGQPGPQPPLGWTLASSTVDDMRAQLSTDQNRAAIAQLRHLLTTPLRCG